MKYWLEWGRWYRWPSYVYLYLYNLATKTRSDCYLRSCPCIDGSNDYYWNGWFKSPKGCECGG